MVDGSAIRAGYKKVNNLLLATIAVHTGIATTASRH